MIGAILRPVYFASDPAVLVLWMFDVGQKVVCVVSQFFILGTVVFGSLDFFSSVHVHCLDMARSYFDEDISSIVTPAAPTATQMQGPITRTRAKQLNYQVLSFLGTVPLIHENMMLSKSDVFVTLRNDGPSMDERDKHWSMIVHGDGSKRLRIKEDTSGDGRILQDDTS